MSVILKRPVLTAVTLLSFSSPLILGQVPFSTKPDWISSDISNYSTGAAWADINGDGWLDLVVANGNDMARQHVTVYYNTATGALPKSPDWQSDDIDYHGHIAVGDVNRDGFPDVAVSVYLGLTGFNKKGNVKLYMNQNGTLSSRPGWTSKDVMYTFSCAFGDADGDGDLDLAVAGGESYNLHPEQNRIYFNNGGVLDPLPSWKSSGESYSYDVDWADFDNDGDLDLVFANEKGPNQIFENSGSAIGTLPVWISEDESQYANSLYVGDVNNDGYVDLAVSDNNQLGGSGHFKIYLNQSGTLDSTPFWSSDFSDYGSGIVFSDIEFDGDVDLITGGWWEPCRIYINEGGTFKTTPQWTSSTNSVVEAIVPGDYDNDGLDTMTVNYVSNGSQKLFYLPFPPIQRLLYILFEDDTVSMDHYCFDLEDGWVSFGTVPWSGVTISMTAVVSYDLDFAVSNWDPTVGNYVFVNRSSSIDVEDVSILSDEFQLSQNYPNPFNQVTTIQYDLPERVHVALTIYDILGREIRTLVNTLQEPGHRSIVWDTTNNFGQSASAGVYLYRIEAGEFVQIKKLLLLR